MLPALLVSYVVSVLFQQDAFRGLDALGEFNSFVLRISLASFMAYVCVQLLVLRGFDLRDRLTHWWVAPSASMILGNLLDTFVFFSVAFWRSSDEFMAANWVDIASVDYATKVVVCIMLFVPLYGIVLNAILR